MDRFSLGLKRKQLTKARSGSTRYRSKISLRKNHYNYKDVVNNPINASSDGDTIALIKFDGRKFDGRKVDDDFNTSSASEDAPGLKTTPPSQAPVVSMRRLCNGDEDIELQLNYSSSSREKSGVLPPRSFLPRKEVRDAILHHEKLGRALSKLALDPHINANNNSERKYPVVCKSSTADSTLITFDSTDSGSEVAGTKSTIQWNASFGSNDKIEHLPKMEWWHEMNQKDFMDQHVSFLQNHKFRESYLLPTQEDEDTRKDISSAWHSSVHCEPPGGDFFPSLNDLKSLSTSPTESGTSQCISSPPNTPKVITLGENNHPQWNKNKSTKNVENSFHVSKQIEIHLAKLTSAVSELKERIDDKSTHDSERQLEDVYGNKENLDNRVFIKKSTPTIEDKGGLLQEMEKAISSMEAKIITSITSEIKANMIQQQSAIEKLIDKKLSQALKTNDNIVSNARVTTKENTNQESSRALRKKVSVPASLSNRSLKPVPTLMQKSGTESSSVNFREANGRFNTLACAIDLNKSVEDSFSDTMKVIDEFVADCDEISNDFDRIALRMEWNDHIEEEEVYDSEQDEVPFRNANSYAMI